MVFMVLGAIKAAQLAKQQLKKENDRNAVIAPIDSLDWWDDGKAPPTSDDDSNSTNKDPVQHSNPYAIGAWSRDALLATSSTSTQTPSSSTTANTTPSTNLPKMLALPAPPISNSTSSRNGSNVSTSPVLSPSGSSSDKKPISNNNNSSSSVLALSAPNSFSDNNEAPVISFSSLPPPSTQDTKTAKPKNLSNLQKLPSQPVLKHRDSSKVSTSIPRQSPDVQTKQNTSSTSNVSSIKSTSTLPPQQSALTKSDNRKRYARSNVPKPTINSKSNEENVKQSIPNTNNTGAPPSVSCMYTKGSLVKRTSRPSNSTVPTPNIKAAPDSRPDQQPQSSLTSSSSSLSAVGSRRKRTVRPINPPAINLPQSVADKSSQIQQSNISQSCMAAPGALKKRTSRLH